MWLSVKTVIIRPQWSVPAARRKPSVCPCSTMRTGISISM
jgi:hypothetical protein